MGFLKRLFKKQKYNIGVIRFGDNIVIPGRDYFKDEKDVELLEEYKKHYQEELCKRKVTTTLSFNSDKLKQDMNMNVDLILRILMDNEDFYLLSPEELMIQSAKLKMYYEEISALEKETILRLVSLKEIEKGKRIPRYNKMALEEEINQLSIILEMYSYRKTAINIELKNYFNVLSTKDLSKEDTGVLDKRLKKLLFITEGIVDREEIDKYEDIKTKIAILERECERYAYMNKEEADELKKSSDLPDENKILLFYEYGKNYFDEGFIKDFYIYKFNMLTCNLNNKFSDSPINKDDYGFSYYEYIISNEIQTMQSSFYFSHLVGDEIDIKSLLEDARRYLKNEYGEFDYGEILTNKLKLAFIFTLHYIDLEYFFNDNIVNPNEPNGYEEIVHKCSSGITWHNSVPLASIFEVASDSSTNHPLYSFYKLNRINTDLLIPEGVKIVNLSGLSEEYLSKIDGDLISGKKYKLPSTLDILTGSLKYPLQSKMTLYLNDGLKCISDDILHGNYRKISIPSSLSTIYYYNLDTCQVGTVEFRDFKKSEIINDEVKFIKFIEKFSTEVDTTVKHYPDGYNSSLQEYYRNGGFSTTNLEVLLDSEYNIYYNIYYHKIQMIFQKLCFASEDLENTIVIPSSELTTTFEEKDNAFMHERDGSPNYKEVYSKIRNILLEKTGYDIAGSKETKEK